jgi:hypothetical protein
VAAVRPKSAVHPASIRRKAAPVELNARRAVIPKG